MCALLTRKHVFKQPYMLVAQLKPGVGGEIPASDSDLQKRDNTYHGLVCDDGEVGAERLPVKPHAGAQDHLAPLRAQRAQPLLQLRAESQRESGEMEKRRNACQLGTTQTLKTQVSLSCEGARAHPESTEACASHTSPFMRFAFGLSIPMLCC